MPNRLFKCQLMINSKLIQVLHTFSSQELLAFRDFVASPFFNKNEELSLLYAYLKKCAPNFSARQLKREKVYKKLFPQKQYNEKHLNYLMSFLLKLCEKFLGLTTFYADGSLADAYTLEAFMERGLDKQYQYQNKRVTEELEKRVAKDSHYLYEQYRLHELRNRHFIQQRLRKNDQNLQLASDYLNLFYLSAKLKLNCEMLDRERILPITYQIEHPQQLLAWKHNNYEQSYHLIDIYQLIYQLQQTKNNVSHFHTIRQQLNQYEPNFSLQELRIIFIHLINFCSQQIREGKIELAAEALDLYLEGIRKTILLDKGILSPWTFKNIIKLQLGLQQYKEAETFIQEKYTLLEEGFQSDAYHYNLADLHYRQQQFGPALDHLNQVTFSDIHYNLGSREMLIKIYYDQEEHELCAAQLEAFRIFLLRNNKVPKNIKAPYRNFIDILHTLIKAPPRERHLVAAKIHQTKQVIDRPWLLNKCG